MDGECPICESDVDYDAWEEVCAGDGLMRCPICQSVVEVDDVFPEAE